VENKKTKILPIPKDPYEHMDIQLCSKYLLFGEQRITGWRDNTPLRITDSANFFRFIQMGDREKKEFDSTLYEAINLRNNRKHETMASYQNMSLDTLSKDVQTLSQMMEPFRRLRDISGGLAPVQTVFDAMQADINTCLGGCPVSVTELCKTILPDNKEAAAKRAPHIQQLLSMAGFLKDGDFVIVDCAPDLLTQAVMVFVQENHQTGKENSCG
jgi:hypothetical protein